MKKVILKTVRVIPRLDVKGPNVVKGIQLEGLRVVGKPAELAKKYYEQGADEILYMDIVASLYERNNLSNVVQEAISLGVFVPMTVGGGVRSLEDIQKLLNAGADKVAINTAATRNPGLIIQASQRFGAQCIVGSVEAKKVGDKKWEAYIDNGREKTGLDAVEWAQKLVQLGAGELLITSVDKDGYQKGYDLELLQEISSKVSVPVIASGGAGSSDDIVGCAAQTQCDGISMGSILHYNKTTITEIKQKLDGAGISFGRNRVLESDLNLPKSIKKKISIIDYGVGNIMSVISAFRRVGSEVQVISTPQEILQAESLVLPGVGAFGEGMKNLNERGLVEAIHKYVAGNKPLLGICLGAQLLLSRSEEFGVHNGLNIIPGKVVKFKDPKEVNESGYRVPQIQWNSLIPKGVSKSWTNTILQAIPANTKMYFIHSYYLAPDTDSVVLATANYGGQEFCAVVQKGKVYGCQFHPEKSGQAGLSIINLFAGM